MPCRRTPSAVRKVTTSEEQTPPLVMRERGACASAQAAHNRSVECNRNLRNAVISSPRQPLGLFLGQDTGGLQLGFKFSQARAERLVPLPARGHILNASGCAEDLSVGRLEQRDVELYRDPPAVLGERGNGKHILAVLGEPGFHDMEVALPVTHPVFLGDDQIHRLAECLVSTPTKHCFSGSIPEPYNALPIAKNDGQWDLFHNAFAKRLVIEDVIHRQLQEIQNEYSLIAVSRR